MEAPDKDVFAPGSASTDVERAGTILRTAAIAPFANSVFTPDELTKRLEAHAARIKREYQEYIKAGGKPDEDELIDESGATLQSCKLPYPWEYDQLCFVYCAACNKELLGSKHEFIRRLAFEKRMVCYAYFPPKVRGRVNDRPVCTECYQILKGSDNDEG
jgi:hypothetical protein